MLSGFSCFQECDTSVHVAVLTGSATETPVLLLKRPHNCSSAVVLLAHRAHSSLLWHCRAAGPFRAGGMCVRWTIFAVSTSLSGLQWDYADLRFSILMSWFKTVPNQETKTAFKGILNEFSIWKGFFCLVFASCGNRSQPNLFLASQSCVSSCTYLFGILSEIFQCRQFFFY